MTEGNREKGISGAGTTVEEKNEHGEQLRRRMKRHRWIACCFGTCIAIVLIVALVLIILRVTVFKVRNPRVVIKSVRLDQFVWKADPLGLNFALNMSLDISLSVKNRNSASFKFGNSTAQLFYRGTNCGDAQIPAGKIGAQRTIEMNTTVSIEADRVIWNPHLPGDILSGFLPLTTSTRIPGRVNLLNVFKHHAISSSTCNFTVAIVNRTILNETCSHDLKF